ncbi:hypothetical protein [Sphaerisporangium fuscum]|uniref:hypothetical protein n=1 Tax=Sphaerisporangium fuscum TaxID=2835868 RepID=UPI001BDC2207|nr:hypothetical protein [Sphaerisporangium fuscum]
MRGSMAAATAVIAGMLALPAPALAQGKTVAVPGSAEGGIRTAPAAVAKKLLAAWARRDKKAAAAVATPAAVTTLFAYAYRTPDRFAGCAANACRFVHTSVRVPGGLNGIFMVVSGGTVTKVYESRHLTSAPKAAKYLFAAWKAGDRTRGLEIASTAAVKKLFTTKFGGTGYTFQGCNPEKGGQACAYSYEGGAMLMHVRGGAARGYEVRSVSYVAD